MARILKDEEKKRIKSAAYNILDKVTAILEETKQGNAYSGYIEEKISSIVWDGSAIEHIINTINEE